MGRLRWVAAVGLVVVVGGVVGSTPPDRTSPARVTSGQPAVQLSVGYETEAGLAAALRTTHAVVVRRLSPLHVAEVSTATPRRVAASQ